MNINQQENFRKMFAAKDGNSNTCSKVNKKENIVHVRTRIG